MEASLPPLPSPFLLQSHFALDLYKKKWSNAGIIEKAEDVLALLY